jgi:signal transduction histidine kinase
MKERAAIRSAAWDRGLKVRGTGDRYRDEQRARGLNAMPRGSGKVTAAPNRVRMTGHGDGRASPLPPIEPGSSSELEVLQGISRAFGSASDPLEVATATVRWVRAAVGTDEARVRLFLLGEDGSLHSLHVRPEPADDPEQQRTRRGILDTLRPSRVRIGGDRSNLTMPLVSRGAPVGVLEVTAPSAALEQRSATLEAVASQVAIVLTNIAQQTSLRSSAEAFREMGSLVGEMARTATPEEAVRAAVRYLHHRGQAPVAGWITRADPTKLELLSVRGMRGARDRLRGRMRTLPRQELRSEEGRRKVADRFAAITGRPRVETVHAGHALLMLSESHMDRVARDTAEPLLEDILANLTVASAAERRSQHLDVGLALTAHEVRGPLIGVMAILDRLSMTAGVDDRALLGRSRRQLDQLAHLVEGLLRWAVAEEQLDLQPTDLIEVIDDAIDMASEETGSRRIILKAPRSLMVEAAPHHLRAAVTNILRNALVYSPRGSTVAVAVNSVGGDALVSIRDRGGGVSAEERENIFDPFIRGSARYLARTGNGLGLFVTRRIMRAHGGEAWLGASGPNGSTFHLQLPRED